MAANVNKWSETPASNATADPAINWAEGQAPSTVNDSARQMMAAIAADRDDTRGSLTFGGTSAALTLATNSVNATYQNGMRVSGKLASAFTANATLNVDSVGAKNIYRYNNAGAAQVQAADGFTGQHVTFEYEAALNSSAGGWVLIGEPVGRVVGFQVLTVTGTYTRNPAASTGDVYVVGGAGAGGGAPATGAGQNSIGGGGGSGSLTTALNVALPATASYTIGAGGTGVSGAGGNSGGASNFNATITANGGSGGGVAGPSTGTFAASPGAGGTAGGGGTFNNAGINGIAGIVTGFGVVTGFGGVLQIQGTTQRGGAGAAIGASSAAQAGTGGNAGFIIVVERA